MRAIDWLLICVAIGAIGVSLFINQQICQEMSGMGDPSGPDRCIPVFPGPALVGLAVAAFAAVGLTIRELRRQRPKDA